jgi:hypothetical protein
MAYASVHFVSPERMQRGFAEIIKANPQMESEKKFFEFLSSLANQATNEDYVTHAVAFAQNLIRNCHCVSPFDILKVIIDDRYMLQTINEFFEIMEYMQKRQKVLFS